MKKLLAITLAVIISICGLLPCIAADIATCNCGQAPIIYVAALGSGSVILDEGTENEKTLFRPDIGNVLNDFTPLIGAATKLIATKDYDAFGDVLISCVNASFGMLALDNEGKSHERVTSEKFAPDTADHGDNYSYYFGYDFRLDPVENAEKLHAYIQEVKALTKHDTIRCRASSMGGVVMLSYTKLYGTKDIETIIFQNCPLQGTAVAGELYNGLFEINKDALVRYAEGALPSMDSNFLAAFLYSLIEMLDAAGVWSDILGMADGIVANLKDRVFDEALIPIFGTMPGIWSFVPDEYYETAKEFMRLDESAHGKLLEKLDFYHYEVQQDAGNLLRTAQADGTNIYIIAGYNVQRTPLVTAYKNTSDGTVDTKYASLGATCAPIGEYLPDGYKQAQNTDKNYMSPDKMIDASTCLLPECTWFVKNMLHSTTHSGHDVLYGIFHSSETQITVFDLKEYPQFIENDTVHESFIPVTREGTPIQEAFKDAREMTSFLTVTQLIITLFEEFFKWFLG